MTDEGAQKLRRNQRFSPAREPLRNYPFLQRHQSRTTGPFTFLNPTRAHYSHVLPHKGSEEATAPSTAEDGEEKKEKTKKKQDVELPPDEQAADDVQLIWSSRNNRKGRHQLQVTPAADPSTAKYMVPDSTNTPKAILKTIGRMFVKYPVWDVSWLVAYIFTWGSIVWVINAFFVWLPLQKPSTEFKNEVSTGGGITAFIGATIFEIGSFFLMFEAVNENREGCFGWAVEQIFYPEEGKGGSGGHPGPWLKVSPNLAGCTHHHQNRRNLVGKSRRRKSPQEQVKQDGDRTDPDPPSPSNFAQEPWREDRIHSGPDKHAWQWFPTLHELSTHYLHQLGFLACTAQLFGASIFWISGFTALPGVLNNLSPGAAINGAYWAPQIIGGSGFIVSGTLFMLETQQKWWKPAFGTLGWHIGLWNLIGGLGFTLCPAFGIDTASWAQYEASLSTFWGSWAFLIGSLIQLYESLQKHPIDVKPAGAGSPGPKPASGKSSESGSNGEDIALPNSEEV